jgi:hypothetical protein
MQDRLTAYGGLVPTNAHPNSEVVSESFSLVNASKCVRDIPLRIFDGSFQLIPDSTAFHPERTLHFFRAWWCIRQWNRVRDVEDKHHGSLGPERTEEFWGLEENGWIIEPNPHLTFMSIGLCGSALVS